MYPSLKKAPVIIPSIPEINIEEDLRNDLYKRAYHTLSYHHPQLRTPRIQNRHELAKVLQQLNINPYTESSIRRYKKLMAQPVNRTLVRAVGLAAFFLGVLVAIRACLQVPHPIIHGALVTILSVLSGIGAIVSAVCGLFVNSCTAEWKIFQIGDYRKRIPDLAIEMSLQIAEKLPSARFYVEELYVTKQTMVIDNDPLFKVEHEQEEFYIYYWDEDNYVPEHMF